jgi:hypothetical protein
MKEWIAENGTLIWCLFGLSVLTFAGTLIVIPILIVRMPADYFSHRRPPPGSWRGRHPAIRITLIVLKNLLGLCFVAAGIVLSIPLIPGQGLLTLLIGISLLDFPGKRALELRIVRTGPVLKAINWIRRTHHRPPLEIAPRWHGGHGTTNRGSRVKSPGRELGKDSASGP